MTIYYRPYGEQWQVLERLPCGLMVPGDLFPTREALLQEYPGATLEHPEPYIPEDMLSRG